ncbi:hypothetical protein H4582DRAFT_1962909 [Lactarius indigo]|nr:hypothetical protein H4582DRAFT_1962909 [Lactarius indigo]
MAAAHQQAVLAGLGMGAGGSNLGLTSPGLAGLHKYTTNFEGMTWKEMVVMDEQALEVQGVVALGACRKMLTTFAVVRRKMGIDDPTAPPPPPAPPSSGGPGSTGSDDGLSSA